MGANRNITNLVLFFFINYMICGSAFGQFPSTEDLVTFINNSSPDSYQLQHEDNKLKVMNSNINRAHINNRYYKISTTSSETCPYYLGSFFILDMIGTDSDRELTSEDLLNSVESDNYKIYSFMYKLKTLPFISYINFLDPHTIIKITLKVQKL